MTDGNNPEVLIIILIVVVRKNDFGAAPTQKAVANISKDVEGETNK
mgnify:CR=1 FL=1